MSETSIFKAQEIFPKTYQISYTWAIPGTGADHVFCYLLEGDRYAVLIDTMYGYGNIRRYVETLTDKPIKVVNTHFHLDHIGGNFDWDTCYLHWQDIPAFNESIRNYAGVEAAYKRCMDSCREECRELFCIEDFPPYRPMLVEPLEDGDIFDLGGKELEVIHVGGHSKGCIALLDRTNRALFTGDCVNSNTLLGGRDKENKVSVQEYMENLLHLETFRDAFDITYGGHQVLPPRVVEDGIALCGKVLAGTDAKTVYNVLGMDMVYAEKRGNETGIPANGSVFNMSYTPDLIYTPKNRKHIIR